MGSVDVENQGLGVDGVCALKGGAMIEPDVVTLAGCFSGGAVDVTKHGERSAYSATAGAAEWCDRCPDLVRREAAGVERDFGGIA